MAVFRKSEIDKGDVRRSEVGGPGSTGQKGTFIGKSLFVKGELRSDEEVKIEGKIEGTLDVKHRVIVGRDGFLKAEVSAREVIIKGRVDGNINGSYRVVIEPEGVLNGNIHSQKVVLAEGAIFKGSIDMSSTAGPKDQPASSG